MAQWVKNLPAIMETWETWIQTPGQEDPLAKEMATPIFLPEKSQDRGAWQATVQPTAKWSCFPGGCC